MQPILAAVDFSKSTDPVLAQAAHYAKAFQTKLWILHVGSDETQSMVHESTQFMGYAPEFVGMPGDVQLAREISAEELKREHAQLHAIAARLRADGVDAQALLLKGDAAKLIIDKAGELAVGLIILGSHGHGLLHKALLGSVSEAVLHRADCNVMVVPARTE